ncbi:MAG: hypothetical protein ACOWWO_15340 [Peptococcaceae bacterium]
MTIGKRLLFALLVAALLFPGVAAAEEAMEIKDFSVDIWPEYDDPGVLVIYRGTFINTGNSDFSGYVKFNIPEFSIPQEGQISMACEIVNGGNHSCQPYNLEDKGDYVELSWKTTGVIKPGQEYPVFLEFYYLPYTAEPHKSFTYDFLANYDIQALAVNIKEPLRAEKFKISPRSPVTNVDSKGFTVHKFNDTDLKAQEIQNYQVEYIKKDNEPSVRKEQQPNQTKSAKGQLEKTNAWKNPGVYMIILVFVVILAGFLVFALFKNNKQRITNESQSTNPELSQEKKKLRQMLLKGKITEQTYRELIRDLEEEYF